MAADCRVSVGLTVAPNLPGTVIILVPASTFGTAIAT